MSRSKKETIAGITPGKAKNALNVAKVIGPAVLPVVVPYAVKAAGVVRGGIDRARARRLGIEVADLSRFTGKGAALHARIAGIERGLRGLVEQRGEHEDDVRFASKSQSTMDKLTAAVRAAETMPASRRKTAHRAVATELDSAEAELLRRLGVR
ncbi:MAG: DUF6474 family protein [Sciscionella sp.]